MRQLSITVRPDVGGMGAEMLREADKWIKEGTNVLLDRCEETSKAENEYEKLKQKAMSLSDDPSWHGDVPSERFCIVAS